MKLPASEEPRVGKSWSKQFRSMCFHVATLLARRRQSRDLRYVVTWRPLTLMTQFPFQVYAHISTPLSKANNAGETAREILGETPFQQLFIAMFLFGRKHSEIFFFRFIDFQQRRAEATLLVRLPVRRPVRSPIIYFIFLHFQATEDKNIQQKKKALFPV